MRITIDHTAGSVTIAGKQRELLALAASLTRAAYEGASRPVLLGDEAVVPIHIARDAG